MHDPPIVAAVDDEPAILDLFAAQLAPEKLDLRLYSGGDMLLNDSKTLNTCDLVLVNVMMPGMDGITLCRLIREMQERFLPILIVTAHGETEQKVRGLDAGANDFLTKPINSAELRARIRANLRAKQLHDELDTAYAELKKLGDLRDNLINMIVHDMRNPLGSVARALEMMGEPPDPTAVDPVTWALTKQQVDHAHELCEQLLDIKRLQAKELPFNPSATSLAETAAQAAEPLKILARERRVEVAIDMPQAGFSTDHELLRRILLHLLGNAIKASPRGEQVSMRGELLPPGVVITVTGKGASAHAGVGSARYNADIGLAFCRLAIEELGGEIEAGSAAGNESVICLRLPEWTA